MTGAELIAQERERQISKEGYTTEHDDEYNYVGQMSQAAVCYIEQNLDDDKDGLGNWPWDWRTWNPSEDPIRNLVKAGALIAAEIDKMQRIRNK